MPFVRFAFVGLANTAFGYSVILLLHYGLRTSPLTANIGGYASGLMLSYVLNRNFTFDSRRSHMQALPRFAAVALACFVLNLLVLHVGLSELMLPVVLAQALAVASYTAAFYLASRFLVFRV